MTLKRTPPILAVAGLLLALAAPASAQAAECADGVRKANVRVQLWKEAHCRGAWIEVGFAGDGDRPDFRRFRHRDGDDYDVDDNRASAVVAVNHCVRFFTDANYGGRATQAALRAPRRPQHEPARRDLLDAGVPARGDDSVPPQLERGIR